MVETRDFLGSDRFFEVRKISRFVAPEVGDIRPGGEFGEGGGDAREFGALGLGGSGGFEEVIADGPVAADAPIGRGHLLDHAHLDVIEGAEALQVEIEQSVRRRLRRAPRERALASGVLGPRERAPLARAARIRFSEIILNWSHDIKHFSVNSLILIKKSYEMN
jgi:hypothetical protein